MLLWTYFDNFLYKNMLDFKEINISHKNIPFDYSLCIFFYFPIVRMFLIVTLKIVEPNFIFFSTVVSVLI